MLLRSLAIAGPILLEKPMSEFIPADGGKKPPESKKCLWGRVNALESRL